MDAKTPKKSDWDGLDEDEIRAKVQANSIARFEECEAARKEALDAGKSDEEAHDAAKTIWNAWAKGIIARRMALEAAGEWSLNDESQEFNLDDYAPYALQHKPIMRDWLLDGIVDLSHIRFEGGGKPDVRGTAKNQRDDSQATVTSIFVDNGTVNFSHYNFPGAVEFSNTQFTIPAKFFGAEFTSPAYFSDAQFDDHALFPHVRFSGAVYFNSAEFTGRAWFPDAQFTGDTNFSDAQFNGDTWFPDVQFNGDTWFSDSQFTSDTWFPDAKFNRDAWFLRAQFSDAMFPGAQFNGTAWFSDAQFTEDANFSDTQFNGDANFDNAKFTGDAYFCDASFTDDANFYRVRLDKDATMGFNGAVFGTPANMEKSTNFGEARFDGPVAFEDVTFHGPTSFRSMRSEVSFRLENTYFGFLADFREVRLAHRPELDGMRIKDPFQTNEIGDADPRPLTEPAPRWWRLLSLLPGVGLNRMAYAPDRDAVAKFRALRGLAMQANDHEQEMAAFAGELRAQRFREHSPFDFRKGKAGRFWLGFLYQHIANFGRSFWRPLELWLGLTVVSFFAHLWAYLPGPSAKTTSTVSAFNIDWPEPPKFSFFEKPLEAIGNSINYVFGTAWAVLSAGLHGSYAWLSQWLTSWDNMSCYSDATGINPFISAVTLAVKNALLFLGGVSVERSRQAAMCLFGRWDEVTGKSIPHGSVLNPAHNYQFEPEIPWAISTLSSVQTLLSIILFFLFLLAVRNHFKIHD